MWYGMVIVWSLHVPRVASGVNGQRAQHGAKAGFEIGRPHLPALMQLLSKALEE